MAQNYGNFEQALLNPARQQPAQSGFLGDAEGGGGVMDPGKMKLDQPLAPKTQLQPQDYQSAVMGALGGIQYGPGSMKAVQEALNPLGFQVQNQDRGDLRPRIKAPNGDVIDIALNEGPDWTKHAPKGAWGFLNRGQEGLDAGGWSFGGGSARPSGSMMKSLLDSYKQPAFQSMDMQDSNGNMVDDRYESKLDITKLFA